MSNKGDIIKLTGTIKKCLPGTKFIVESEDKKLITTCTISGKLRQNKIRLYENDKVDFEVSVYDLNTGRIVWRY